MVSKTTIQVDKDVLKELNDVKVYRRETHNDAIKRMIADNIKRARGGK